MECSSLIFLVRVIVYPKWSRFFSRLSSSQLFFFFDLCAAVPFGLFVTLDFAAPLEDGFGPSSYLFLGLAPLIRLLKILRYMPNFHLLSHAFILLCEAIPTMLFVMVIIMWFFSGLIALLEPSDNIRSLPHAMWMVVVTMTTVGYGDVFPTTSEGYVVCSLLAVVSILYMAMPLGIIGNIFTHVWEDRHRILLMKRTRARIAQWGYSAQDIPELFQKFDPEGKGELDVFAFRDMVENMHIGLEEKRIFELFEQFDIDRSGSIDAPEFIRHLFPKTFHELYGHHPDAIGSPPPSVVRGSTLTSIDSDSNVDSRLSAIESNCD